ncbi:MAG: HAD family hydrolase [Phycisphaerales bacterium]|nr:HAD family hydrolase [Phycisphaerales bacterium]
MPIELVIFDSDGVLVDSEPVANRELAALLTECGLPVSAEQAMQWFIGHAMPDVLGIAEQKLGRRLPPDFLDRLQIRTETAFRHELRPVTGVEHLIARLNVPYCVASNGPIAKMRATLGATGLLPRFEGRLFSADHVKHPKPAPDLFLHASATMRADPTNCVVVEDGVFGVRAAIAAGMRAIGYAERTDSTALTLAGATVCMAMAEVETLIRAWQ